MITERDDRLAAAQVLRGLRRQLRRAGGRCQVTQALLKAWKTKAGLLQCFRRQDARVGVWL